MAVFRVEKNANYTTMSNYHLRDKNLTLKAKGLLSMFLSLPENWCYSIQGIAAICKEGEDSIAAILRELERNRYLVRNQTRGAGGRMSHTEYVIYENPYPEKPSLEKPVAEKPYPEKPVTDNPVPENPCPGKPCPENPAQINTDKRNTDQNKERGEEGGPSPKGAFRNVFLTEEEMKRLREEFPSDYAERIEKLSGYMASSGKEYRNHYATICTWARKDRESAQKADTVRYDPRNYIFLPGESL